MTLRRPTTRLLWAIFLGLVVSCGGGSGGDATQADAGSDGTTLEDTRDGGDATVGVDAHADARDATAETIAADAAMEETSDGSGDVADGGCDDPCDPLGELADDALRQVLAESVGGHTSLGYDEARDYMYTNLDVRGGEVECIYTGTQVPADGTNAPGGVISTEHAWPQSLGASEEPAVSDLHHLFPATRSANSVRNNLLYGDTDCEVDGTCTWAEAGSARGPRAGGGPAVFEARPEYRGDVARAWFYFSVRYDLPIEDISEATLRGWHEEDPPSRRETSRNGLIERVQGNRNPFIDRPELVERIADF